MTKVTAFLLSLCLALSLCDSATAGDTKKIIYVNGRARNVGDGSGWQSPLGTVVSALKLAEAGDQIWVSAGTYKPTSTSNRTKSFRLKRGVALYGGFAGRESKCDQRDWTRNATILSGDIGREESKTDNSFHVVVGADKAILDGFIITGGYNLNAEEWLDRADFKNDVDRSYRVPGSRPGGKKRFPGGGKRRGGKRRSGAAVAVPLEIFPAADPGGNPRDQRKNAFGDIQDGQALASPQEIIESLQSGFGAGMVNFQCAPIIRNCTFKDNKALKGGGMYNMCATSFPIRTGDQTPAYPKIVKCIFEDNYAQKRGGAVSNDLNTSPSFIECSFINNRCDIKGGGMYNDFTCSPLLKYCLFTRNYATIAGAMGNSGGSSPLIICCTFAGNKAKELGSALYQGTGVANNPTIINSIIWGNVCKEGPANMYNWHDCSPTIMGSCIEGGYPGDGNTDKDPKFRDSRRDDYELKKSSPCLNSGYTGKAPDIKFEKNSNEEQQQDFRTQNLKPSSRPASPLPRQAIVYVSAIEKKIQDGKSWATAYQSLQAGIDHAWRSNGEVWVAKGVYLPTPDSDRAASFILRPRVKLFGGFKGFEMKRDERNPKDNLTILSGEIGDPNSSKDNCYHVIIGSDSAMLDGFTVSDGYANGIAFYAKGGGMINYVKDVTTTPRGPSVGYSPIIQDCLFTNNFAIEGGAIYNFDRTTPIISDCYFKSNMAYFGGAIVDRVGVKSKITQCKFYRNKATWRGGAIYLDYGARPIITDCTFSKNSSACHGGAIYALTRPSQLEYTVITCVSSMFTGNRAKKRGGAIALNNMAMLTATTCSFFSNSAGTGGGALACDDDSKAIVTKCKLRINYTKYGKNEIDADKSCEVTTNK